MRALITGITGFVGGFLAEHLLSQGDEVLGCSASARIPGDWPVGLAERVEVVRWDVAEPSEPGPAVLERLSRYAPEVAYHLAALSVPEDCGREEPTARAWAVNVDGTAHVARAIEQNWPTARLVLASTSHVYQPPTSEHFQFDEQTPTLPRRGYGRTKLAAEQVVVEAAARGLDTVIVRAFQHTGPRQSARMMLPQWCEQFARPSARPVEIYNCNTWIDLSDVRDVVRAYRLLAVEALRGEIYNVGSGVATRSGEVLDLLRALADPARPIIELRPGTRQDPIADTSRLAARTRWRPEIPLDQTVRDTFQYWVDKLRSK